MHPIIVDTQDITNPIKGPKTSMFKEIITESGNIGMIDSKITINEAKIVTIIILLFSSNVSK